MANCAGVPADHWECKLLLAHKGWFCQLEYPLEGLATVNLKNQLALLRFLLSVTKRRSGWNIPIGKKNSFQILVEIIQEWQRQEQPALLPRHHQRPNWKKMKLQKM